MNDTSDTTGPGGRVAVVTGGSRGIGRACAAELARRGHDVMILYRRDHAAAAQAVQEIVGAGGRAAAIQADVTDEGSVRQAFRTTLQTRGRPSVVVVNAGVTADGLLATMSAATWSRVVDTNLLGSFLVARESVKAMRRTGGSLVLMSSTSGLRGQPGQGNYSASKGGINALTQSLAKEVAHMGIRVNAIAPGFTDTAMLQQMDRRSRDEYTRAIPLGRIAHPHEIASVAAFLASDDASYMTGQIVAVDGGLTA